MELIDKFEKWTDALIDHFFKKDSTEEVYLYINEEELDNIGSENGLGNHEDFLSTFLLSIESRRKIYNELAHTYISKGHKCSKPNLLNSNSILDFALLLADEFSSKDYFFPYIIVCIYAVGKSNETKDTKIGGALKEFLEINIKSENGRYKQLEELLEELHFRYPNFNNGSLTRQRYVGLLKYQLIISGTDERELKEAICSNTFDFSEDVPYEEKIYHIHDYVSDKLKEILDKSLTNIDYRKRINSIFENTDTETYKSSIKENGSLYKHGSFVLCLYLGSERNELRLYTDVKDRPVSNQDLTITPSLDSFLDYNVNPVVVSDGVKMKGYNLSVDGLTIKSLPLRDVVYFSKYNAEIYIQVAQPLEDKPLYIAVKNKKRNIQKFEKTASLYSGLTALPIECQDAVEELLGQEWILYYAESKSCVEKDENKKKAESSIRLSGGIIPPGKRNTYLASALPYFEFSGVVPEKDGLSVDLCVEDNELLPERDFNTYIKGNKVIIDLCNNDLDFSQSKHVDVTIECFGSEDSESYWICGQNINYDGKVLYKYDRWGDFKQGDAEKSYLQGNNANGTESEPLKGCFIDQQLEEFNSQDLDSFYFINLLSSCCYMDQEGEITPYLIKKCLRYTSSRLGMNDLDTMMYTRITNVLVNTGYLAYNPYNRKYQLIPTTFVRVPKSLGGINNTQLYLLSGCFTKTFLEDLKNYCEKKGVKILRIPYMPEGDNIAGRLIPPAIYVDYNINFEEFKNTSHHSFDIIYDCDASADLLAFSENIGDYENTLKVLPKDTFNAHLRPAIENQFPRVRIDNNPSYNRHYFIENSEGIYATSSIREQAWSYIYCQYKRSKPFIYLDANGSTFYVPLSTHLPSIIQRALYLSNGGLPNIRKVFCCEDSDKGKRFYSLMKEYKIDSIDTRWNKLLYNLTGYDTKDNNPSVKSCCRTKLTMELWSRKQSFDNSIPRRILILKNQHTLSTTTDVIAVSSLTDGKEHECKTYLYKEDAFHHVYGEFNNVMSQLILKNNWKYDDFSMDESGESLDFLDQQDKYKVDNILIK